MAEIARRAAVVFTDDRFGARVGMAMEQRHPPFEPAQVVEGRMYEGFPTFVHPILYDRQRSAYAKRGIADTGQNSAKVCSEPNAAGRAMSEILLCRAFFTPFKCVCDDM
ncbi:hypothetical protein [Tateyamaria pelophila]|uniref:hypothetical protein n=1 Tax=Tateyamaria pelophila TaxID=328415 RepID=UPI001CBAF291|nr:hypothetical protein [Tateyamaria pelophila]